MPKINIVDDDHSEKVISYEAKDSPSQSNQLLKKFNELTKNNLILNYTRDEIIKDKSENSEEVTVSARKGKV